MVLQRACNSDNKRPFSDFTGPLDAILNLTQTIHQSKRQTSSANMLEISGHVSEMKNRIINTILPLLAQSMKSETAEITSHNTCKRQLETPSSVQEKEWPALDRIKKQQSAVIVKSGSQKKFERSDADLMESKFNELLSNEAIEGTIVSSGTTKNGDIMINFNKGDNVKDIADKVESNLGYKTRTRGSFLPKVTISRVPKYIHMHGDSPEGIKKTIMCSNQWLQAMIESGETFAVLFSYEVREYRNIVCKVSPRIRSDILKRGSSLRIENRSCRVNDRFHILQCGKCLEFGHKAQNCARDTVSCKHCGDDGHLFGVCPHKDNKDKMRCSNCKKLQPQNTMSVSADHSSRSHSCPLYIKRLEYAIGMTNWGDGPIPSI